MPPRAGSIDLPPPPPTDLAGVLHVLGQVQDPTQIAVALGVLLELKNLPTVSRGLRMCVSVSLYCAYFITHRTCWTMLCVWGTMSLLVRMRPSVANSVTNRHTHTPLRARSELTGAQTGVHTHQCSKHKQAQTNVHTRHTESASSKLTLAHTNSSPTPLTQEDAPAADLIAKALPHPKLCHKDPRVRSGCVRLLGRLIALPGVLQSRLIVGEQYVEVRGV